MSFRLDTDSVPARICEVNDFQWYSPDVTLCGSTNCTHENIRKVVTLNNEAVNHKANIRFGFHLHRKGGLLFFLDSLACGLVIHSDTFMLQRN